MNSGDESKPETPSLDDWAEEESTASHAEVRARKATRSYAELRSQYNQLLDEKIAADERLTHLLDLNQAVPTTVKIRSRKPKSKSEACPVLLASDWHVGERVDPKTINNRNEYNPEIAADRAENYFQNGLHLIQSSRKSVEVTQAILWLGGDFITGYIHEELEESNWLSPTEESMVAHEVLSAGIDYFLKRGDLETLHVPCNYGNHGRTTRKPRVSTGAKNSYEWLLYQHLKLQYRNEPRVQFHISNGYHQLFDIYGFRIRFHHGDAIHYRDGLGGVSIPLNKAILRWNTGEPADLDCLGHWHQYTPGSRFIINGSLIGWNAYANHIRAEFQEPMQAYFLVDSERGRHTNLCPIWVTDPPK